MATDNEKRAAALEHPHDAMALLRDDETEAPAYAIAPLRTLDGSTLVPDGELRLLRAKARVIDAQERYVASLGSDSVAIAYHSLVGAREALAALAKVTP